MLAWLVKSCSARRVKEASAESKAQLSGTECAGESLQLRFINTPFDCCCGVKVRVN